VTSILAYFCKFPAVLPGAAERLVFQEIFGLTFSLAEFARRSRSAPPYARMNLVQTRFR